MCDEKECLLKLFDVMLVSSSTVYSLVSVGGEGPSPAPRRWRRTDRSLKAGPSVEKKAAFLGDDRSSSLRGDFTPNPSSEDPGTDRSKCQFQIGVFGDTSRAEPDRGGPRGPLAPHAALRVSARTSRSAPAALFAWASKYLLRSLVWMPGGSSRTEPEVRLEVVRPSREPVFCGSGRPFSGQFSQSTTW